MKRITKGDKQYCIGGLVVAGEVALAICLTNLLIFSNFGFSGLTDMGPHTRLVFCASLAGICVTEYIITTGFVRMGFYLYLKWKGLNENKQPGI